MKTGEKLDVVVIGAGFCGLAAAASLKAHGIRNFAVLEQGAGVGHFWSRTYDRIHLHSPWHDLPHDGGANAAYPMFKSRDDLLRYFRGYADFHALGDQLRLGHTVHGIRRSTDRGELEWQVETSEGRFSSRYLMIATAANRAPHVPDLRGRERFEGLLLHSSEYRNARPFRGKRVLVVGSGNSAAEIALDLVEGGADSVQMWVRGPRHFLRLRTMKIFYRVFRALGLFTTKKLDEYHQLHAGTPEFEAAVKMRDTLPRRFSIDLSRHGIRKPERGPMVETYITRRIPVFDQGAIPLIQSGAIGIIDGNRRQIEEITARGVRFGDSTEDRFDAVVLATGFVPRLEVFVQQPEMLVSEAGARRGFPRTDGRSRSTVYPSAFFPGFDLSVNGGQSLGRWGWEAAAKVAAALNGP